MEDETKAPFPASADSGASSVVSTQTIERSTGAAAASHIESRVGGVSVRAIIVTLVVLTVCGMSVAKLKVEEPLYTLVGLTVGYYFGQNTKTAKP